MIVYIPMDRRQALARGEALPDRAYGAALTADVSGFTPLAESLGRALGPQRGAEELTRQLNLVYDALIAEVDRYGGSVIGFSGDALTCWFGGDGPENELPSLRATAAAIAMQSAMDQFGAVLLPQGGTVTLAMKAAVATGLVRRFLVGSPDIQLIDVLAGATLDRLAAAERLAGKGEVVVDPETGRRLGGMMGVGEWRAESDTGERFAVVSGLTIPVTASPWPAMAPDALGEEQLRPWLLPAVYQRLSSGQGAFLAELRPAVALFLRFGGIDYDDDPSAAEKLDSYIRWVHGVIARYEGALIQVTIGDKGSYLYAAFGAPIAHSDDAARAVSAAAALRSPPVELDFIRTVQIGLSQGRMRTGSYGGTTRHTYGVLGDEVNLAARLMQFALPGQVIAGERVAGATGEAFAWEPLGAIQVKGRTGPINIFALAGVRSRPAIHLQEPSYVLPMVGRRTEVALIEDKLELVLQGQGQIVAIVAEAGMGKSRLVSEIIRRASERGLEGFGGECQSFGTNAPYLVWQPIWRGLFGLEVGAPVDDQVRILEAVLTRLDPTFVPRLPLLGALLNLPISDNDLTRAFDAKLRKESLEALLVDFLKARARSPGNSSLLPILLVLEDCHWLDPLSHDLLEMVGRVVANLPVLVLLAYRPPEGSPSRVPPLGALPHFTEIRLSDFTPEEAMHLIRLKLAQLSGLAEEPAASLVERLTERAGGNPFYLEELLNYLRDRGLDPRDTHSHERLDWPDSLHSLILSRMDQLGESQKITLKVASIIGRLFRMDWLWGVYPGLGHPAQVKADLEALSRLDLTPLDMPEPVVQYLFKHIVTQEVAYESQPYAARAEMHGRLGRFLEGAYAEALEQYIDLLALHYGRSSNFDKQREYFRRAGDAAQAAYANAAAMDYYRRLLRPELAGALPASEQIEITLKLGQVLQLVGLWDEAETQYQRAFENAGEQGDGLAQSRSQQALGSLFQKRGEYAGALAWLERARAGFESLGDQPGVSGALIEMGEVYQRQGDYSKARELQEESLTLAQQIGDKKGIAQSLNVLGFVAYFQGDYAAARALHEDSLALMRQLGDRRGIAASLVDLGIVARNQGDYETARALYLEGLSLMREVGDKWSVAALLNNLGNMVAEQGDYPAARASLEESLALVRELGDRRVAAISLQNLGLVALAEGDFEDARARSRESLKLAQELGDKQQIAYGLVGLAGVSIQDRPGAAEAIRAARLSAAVEDLLQKTGAVLEYAERAVHDHTLSAARARLDAAAFSSAWAEGQAMTVEQAVEYAQERGPAV